MVAKSLSTSQRYARLNEVAGRLAEFCQAMYPLLVAHADDFGRLAGDVFTVKHLVVPTSKRKESDVEKALAALHEVGLIVWYEAEGRKCIQIHKFEDHQQGLHKRTKSEFPYAESESPGISGNVREIPSEEKRTEQKGTEGKGDRRAPLVDRHHRSHAHCGRVCLPASLFSEFVRRRNHDNADMELREWALAVEGEWSERPDEPGDAFDFWKARYAEKWPPTPVVKVDHSKPEWYRRVQERKAQGLA